MNLKAIMCVCVLLCTITGCVCVRYGSSIVGGHDATRGAWPWMVYLRVNKVPCGGTVISDQWIMTAAHCWSPVALPSDLQVRVGELSLKEPSGRQVQVGRVVVHPDYREPADRWTPFHNDIALLQLTHKLHFSDTVKTVKLPISGDTNFTSATAECWVTGWGRVGETTKLGGLETLQEVQLPLVDDRRCRELYPEMTHGHICAGDLAGGRDACQGDSGGPLVCRPAGGTKEDFVQVGITSFGRGCAKPKHAGLYTRVSNYMEFIKNTTATG